MPMDSKESSIHTISSCCFCVSPTASGEGQSILATVAIHAPRKEIGPPSADRVLTATADRIQTTMLRNLTIFYMEYLRIRTGLNNLGQVLAVGVGDEDLTELFPLYHRYDALHAFAIQPVEDIIQ